MKKLLFLGIVAFVFSGCVYNSGNKKEAVKGEKYENDEISQVCFPSACFNVEVANNDEARKRGLMFREHLADDAGMLFIFDDMSRRRKFRMKNTKIPLDMIWLDDTGKIVFIEKNVMPCQKDPCPNYGPNDIESKYVLELNAGTIDKIGAVIGEEIRFH